jgi:hypothetical protein
MNLGDELQKLSALHASGSLTEEEFKRAKERLLSSAPTASSDPVVTAVNAFRRLGMAAHLCDAVHFRGCRPAGVCLALDLRAQRLTSRKISL